MVDKSEKFALISERKRNAKSFSKNKLCKCIGKRGRVCDRLEDVRNKHMLG